MTLTVSDLLAYAKSQARIEAIDYICRYERRLDRRLESIRSWRNDRASRDRARLKVLRTFPGRISANAPLVPGTYGAARRLEITAEEIDYTACQYSAMEIWGAVLAYFNATNEVAA
jgi:hypothetical protein